MCGCDIYVRTLRACLLSGKLIISISQAMGSLVSDYFIDPQALPAGTSGLVQVLFLAAIYGYALLTASQLISDGSELLLLVPALAGVVGSIVLPILGAVPDG